MNFFKAKAKTPQETVRAVKDALVRFDTTDNGGNKKERAGEQLSKDLLAIKVMLYGDGETDPIPELVNQVATEIYNNQVLFLLVQNIGRLEFEAKKDVAQIFNNLLRRQVNSRSPTVEHLCGRPDVVFLLVDGYENQEIALNCGIVIRECVRHEALCKLILHSQPHFGKFFDFVELSTFDIASDAFATFKDLLTKHKILVAQYLEANYDWFFERYTRLLNSNNYVTKRQSLKLLGEILLDRSKFNVMTKYIAEANNVKLMMNLLRDKSKSIQFEAFHVFKIFVANPNKTKPIQDILAKNRERLIQFLSSFHNDRTDDEQFNDEKAFLIKQIEDMPALPAQ